MYIMNQNTGQIKICGIVLVKKNPFLSLAWEQKVSLFYDSHFSPA